MITLLVDANLDGHAELLRRRLYSDNWREISEHLDIQFLYFASVGLSRAATDDVVWQLCQENHYWLLTANRNQESDDSLEATIRREGTLESLPVLTLSDADRLYHSAEYLDEVTEQLLDFLLYREDYYGSGRLYLP